MRKEDLKSLIVDELANCGFSTSGDVQLIGPLHERPYGMIYQLKIANAPFPFAVKVCRYPTRDEPNIKFSKRQYADLERFYNVLKNDPVHRVSQPICLLEDHAVVVMEWAVGRSAVEYLLDWHCSGKCIEDKIRKAALLLKQLHEKCFQSLDYPTVECQLEKIDQLLKSGKNQKNYLYRFNEQLKLLAPEVRKTKIPFVYIHGDYQPSNIIFSKDKVYAIDVTYSRVEAANIDVVTLLNTLSRIFLLPKGFRLLPIKNRIFNAFYKEYYGDNYKQSLFVLTWMMLQDQLRFYLENAGSNSRSLKNFYFDISQRRLMTGLLKELNSNVGTN